MWMILALLSAVFAALTSILAKVGIEDMDATLATAIRTVVVVLMAWGMVFLTKRAIPRPCERLESLALLLFCLPYRPAVGGCQQFSLTDVGASQSQFLLKRRGDSCFGLPGGARFVFIVFSFSECSLTHRA